MPKYTVSYAGLPIKSKRIEADNPFDAAVEFFEAERAKNSIIVKAGWFKESVVTTDDILRTRPDIRLDDLPFLSPERSNEKRPPFWKEYLKRLILLGGNRSPY